MSNSRRTSRPMSRKKDVMRPSLTQCARFSAEHMAAPAQRDLRRPQGVVSVRPGRVGPDEGRGSSPSAGRPRRLPPCGGKRGSAASRKGTAVWPRSLLGLPCVIGPYGIRWRRCQRCARSVGRRFEGSRPDILADSRAAADGSARSPAHDGSTAAVCQPRCTTRPTTLRPSPARVRRHLVERVCLPCRGVAARAMTLEDVKNLLGHSTIVLTSNTYGHVLERRQ